MIDSETMSSSNSVRALVTLCVVLTWGLGVFATSPRMTTNDYFDPNKWDLVPGDNSAVTSLSDLKDGVYSIQLSGERSGCGLGSQGPGMVIFV